MNQFNKDITLNEVLRRQIEVPLISSFKMN